MALSANNISTSLVSQTLGVNSHDVGTLCFSPNVNKWSFYKPVSIAKSSGLSNSDYYSVDDGFTIPTYNTPYEMVQALAGGATWTYNPPVGGSGSPFRLGDFRGYEHTATSPFTFSCYANNVEYGGEFLGYLGADIASIVGSYNKFNGVRTTTEVGLLFLTSWNTSVSSGYYYKIANIQDFNNLAMTVPNSLVQNTTYYVIPTLCNETNVTAGQLYFFNSSNNLFGTWYLMPTNYTTMTITGSQGSGSLGNISISIDNYDMTQNVYYYTFNSITATFYNSNSIDVTVYQNSSMTDAMNNNQLSNFSVYIPANSSTTVEIVGSSPHTYESATGNPILDIHYTYESASTDFTYYFGDK